jgi:hypothetical protein
MAFKVQVDPAQIAIHQGQTVLLTEPGGEINWPSKGGLYFRDTRVISAWAIYAGSAVHAWPLRFLTDAVEKVFWEWRTKFSRAADAFRAQRCEGPRRISEKQPRTFVSALRRIPTAELSKNQHFRDFWRRSIFDFFDSIDPTETSGPGYIAGRLSAISPSLGGHPRWCAPG